MRTMIGTRLSLLILITSSAALGCRGGDSEPVDYTHAALVDDFRPRTSGGGDWGLSRLDTVRIADGVSFIDDAASVSGSGGTAAALGRDGVGLRADRLLGPLISAGWQPRLVGVQVSLDGGGGELSVRLSDPDGATIWSAVEPLDARSAAVSFLYDGDEDAWLGEVSWRIDDGWGAAERVKLLIEAPQYADPMEETFLYTYAALSRCWDGDAGLIAARCADPDGEQAPEATALFALATAVAWDLGYVSGSDARAVAEAARASLLEAVPRQAGSGLLPERMLAEGSGYTVSGESYWSSLHTAVAVEAMILAAEATGLATDDLEALLEEVDWAGLTDAGAYPVLAGQDPSGAPLDWRLGVFGSKAVLVQIAHAAVTGELPPMELAYIPTWDGSGYDDELAALLFPMTGIDSYNNAWQSWRDGAFWKQHGWTQGNAAGERGLFGLSAAEVAEPWLAEGDGSAVYGDWGVGGHNQFGNDGSQTVGYAVHAPHYAAMAAAEHPDQCAPLFEGLLRDGLLGPLNAVESAGIDSAGALRWNHTHRAWTLALQALGAGRALSVSRAGDDYLPYRMLDENDFLRLGFEAALPGGAP